MTGIEELAALGVAAAGTAADSAPAWLPYATAATTAASAGVAYKSANDKAAVASATGNYNARELERAAAQERAAGVRKAQEQEQQTQRVLSTQRAVAANSGAGTSEGQGYLDIVGDTAERGRYLSDLDIGLGEQAATARQSQANQARWKGDVTSGLYKSEGNAALIKGAFDIANTGLKRNPVASSSSGGDDLIDASYDPDSGWDTMTKRAKARGTYY